MTLPRIVHVLPHPAPYAQLCVRRVGKKLYLFATMVSNGEPSNGIPCCQDDPVGDDIVGENDKEFSELAQASSIQSSLSHDEGSEHWASTGWDDLCATVSLSSSSSSSSSDCNSSGSRGGDGFSRGDCDSSQQQGIIWLDENWLGMDGNRIGDGDAWLLGDDACLDRSRKNSSDAVVMEATLCGRIGRRLALGKAKSHRSKRRSRNRRSSLPTKLSVKLASYSVLS